jgi:formate hydrogenlyase subunit 3/multisubunit Na+/H+ antiporter MnhD subunit
MLSALFLFGVFSLFSGALLPPLVPGSGKKTRKAALGLTALAALLLLACSLMVFNANTREEIAAYKVASTLPFSFALDRLSSFFIIVISIVSFCVAVYSTEYTEHGGGNTRRNILVCLMNVFIASMVLVVASTNTFSFLFFWEVMSLSSFFLVMYEYEKKETRKAGVFYFVMTQLSTVFLMVGFFALYQVNGSYNIEAMGPAETLTTTIIFLSLLTGFSIKAGVIPFHKWLPYAHAASPSNISALMSGVMIKVAIYGLMRFVLYVLKPVDWWGILILVLGTISALYGIIYALKEHDIKRLLAYSSIENIGTILIGFGLYIIFQTRDQPTLASLAIAGSLFHILNHGVFKSLLFMVTGSIVNATHTRDLESMGGLIKKMPYTAALFLVGALSISALPPLNGFVSEYLLFMAFFGSNALTDPMLKVLLIFCLALFSLTSAFVATCFVKAYGITFLGLPRSDGAAAAKEAKKPMIAGPAILAGLCILLGIFSPWLLASAGYETIPIPNLLFVGSFILITYALIWTAIYYSYPNKERLEETWDCGTQLTSRTEYTATGFSQPIMRIFKATYRTQEVPTRVFHDKYNSIFKTGEAKIILLKFFEEYLYIPVAKRVMSLSNRVSRMQNWNLDTYIAYAFIAVLAVLIYVGWLI